VDDTSDGFYGIVNGATLAKNLIEPALKAADAFLPLDKRGLIDGFPARNSVVRDSFPGILSAPPVVRPRPFEIILEAPKGQPAFLTECALWPHCNPFWPVTASSSPTRKTSDHSFYEPHLQRHHRNHRQHRWFVSVAGLRVLTD